MGSTAESVLGIFIGMFSPSSPDEVLAAIGDRFLRSIAGSVVAARRDIREMRAWRPGWFPPMSARCLANLIHDRIWAQFAEAIHTDATVILIESGPTREIQAGSSFRLRIKRHHDDDSISTYPTQTALAFYVQKHEQLAFDGFEIVKLAAGYRWDPELREIQAPVISYRDGKDNPIWAVELSEPEVGAVPITWKPIEAPALPMVELVAEVEENEAHSDDR